MYAGAPIMNNGYYDVPICNQYSNKEVRDKPRVTNQYDLNREINLTLNNNKGDYTVYQDPTVPSPSLYLESDQPMSGYYYKDPMSLSFDSEVPLVKKKEMSTDYNYINSDRYPPFGIEKFRGGGGGGHGGGGHMGGGGGHMGGGHMGGGGGHMGGGGGHMGGGGHRGGYGGGVGYGGGGHRGGYGRGGYGGYGYLNTALMPNVNTLYWNNYTNPGYTYADPGYTYADSGYTYSDNDYPEYIEQPVRQVIVEKPVYEEVKIESLESKPLEEDTKIIKKKLKKNKNKNLIMDNKILFGVIILLIIIICLLIAKIYKPSLF